MRVFSISILVLSILIQFSCGTELESKGYAKYIVNPENGLNKTKEVGSIRLGIQYKPGVYMALQKNGGKADGEDFDRDVESFSGMQHFNMKLAVGDGGTDVTNYGTDGFVEEQERIAYLSFGMGKDIRLVQGKDTLPCLAYHFERSYDMAPHRTFVLGFEERGKTGDRILIWDSPVFGTGPVKMAIREKDIQNIPELKR